MYEEVFIVLGVVVKKLGPWVVRWIVDYIQSIIPTRNLWQIVEPDELVVVASTSAVIYPGEYERPVTGVGQLQALGYAAYSLKKAYRDLDLNRVYLSRDALPDLKDRDLLLLGSPKTNTISGRFLNALKNDQPAIQEGSVIRWRNWTRGGWTRKGKDFAGETDGERVVKDCGLIVRAKSPFTSESKDRTVVLFSGSHTYGTALAAKYYVEKMPKVFGFGKLESNNVAALVSARIRDGRLSTRIRLENSYIWPKE